MERLGARTSVAPSAGRWGRRATWSVGTEGVRAGGRFAAESVIRRRPGAIRA